MTAESGNQPESVKPFLKNLFTTEKTNREKVYLIVNLVTLDFVHNISHGKVITSKHYLFVPELHNLTRQKQAVVIANKFEHCISYDLCCKAETSLSEPSIATSKERRLL